MQALLLPVCFYKYIITLLMWIYVLIILSYYVCINGDVYAQRAGVCNITYHLLFVYNGSQREPYHLSFSNYV